MRTAPHWFRTLLYDLHLRRLEWFCERVGRHICIYPPGHMTDRELDEAFKRIKELGLDSE
jgi:hypothetical protein